MGRESTCDARLDGKASSGKALLETAELLFRGAAFRASVPFKEMTRVEADARELTVVWPGGTLVLQLGPEAGKWADKIRNPPSRTDKLGVKAGMRIAVLGAAAGDCDFLRELAARGAAVVKAGAVDLLFLSADRRADLGRLADLKRRIHPNGAIWILRPKGAATISERDVMAAGRAAGLVDVKVAAFSPTHTAEKLVIPVAQRPVTKPAGAGAASIRSPRAKARSRRAGRSTT